jgi:hypothetical protein
MSKESVGLGTMVLGLVLLIASFWWSGSSDPPSSWDDKSAQAYYEAGKKLHDMSFQTKRNSAAPRPGENTVTAEELAAQKKIFEDQQAVLDGARHGRTRTSWVMFGAGIALTMVGLFATKLSGSD